MSELFGIVATAGVIVLAVLLARTRAAVDQLQRMHAPSARRVLREVSIPVGGAGIRGMGTTALTRSSWTEDSWTEDLIIRGYQFEIIVMDNYPDGKTIRTKDVTVTVPDGTLHVVASIRGFDLLFGELKEIVDGTLKFRIADHHLGFEHARIEVIELQGQTATLRVHMLLSDVNGDDKWTGLLIAHLLFLGRHPECDEPIPPDPSPPLPIGTRS